MRKEYQRKYVWAVEPLYDDIEYTASDHSLIPVRVQGKWGFINKSGEIIIKPHYEEVLPFSEGLAAVKEENYWGYINTSGEIVIEPQFHEIPDSFSEGLVRIARFDKNVYEMEFTGVMSVQSRFGYADREGSIVIEPQYRIADSFSQGLAAVSRNRDGYGYINMKGEVVIDFVFEEAFSFLNNMAVVCYWGKWGMIRHPSVSEGVILNEV